MGYEWLALLAAFLWAFSSMISVTPARHLGTFAYSRWRMACVTLMLCSAATFMSGWSSLLHQDYAVMALSGLIGIFIGDTALFACFNRVGPRRAGLLFSCHAVFSAILGVWLFDESLYGWKLVGAILVFSGVLLAVFFGQNKRAHSWEKVNGNLWIAISLGLTAALCQSLGAIIAKPVMSSGSDPIAASAIRMATALTAHCVLFCCGFKIAKASSPMNWSILGQVALNGFLAMGVGMTLIMIALSRGDVGMVGLLSSTTPIMILPLMWLFTRQRPSLLSWVGAILAVAGTGMILKF
ncbi:DMT family transporter [Thaumasiovibrio subtropicus]|uniref:DMT family transporter n=1 Tax=Thaumasiovibrio subtropicus TaxID=1891207 RepID=UPI000B351D03|nr:DMT family transporter [Thaumasiovibrio subtropicus]